MYFEAYNELKDLPGEEHTAYNFNFSINQKRYQVMRGDEAEKLQYIDKEDNWYKIILADAEKNVLFSMDTEKEYAIDSIREHTDTDGKVYIMYSKYTSSINSFVQDIKSTSIMKMDIGEDKAELEKQYDFGPAIIVLSVYDGYVYTMEDGRIYRKLLDGTGDKECMADLGFRGMPDINIDMIFYIEKNGVKINIVDYKKETISGHLVETIADVKYTDQPIKTDN